MYGKEKKKHLGGYIVNVTEHGDPNSYSTEVWDWMVNNNIKSIIDVGCGEGHSTKYFLDKGMEAIGVEGGENAYNNSPVKKNLILRADLKKRNLSSESSELEEQKTLGSIKFLRVFAFKKLEELSSLIFLYFKQ